MTTPKIEGRIIVFEPEKLGWSRVPENDRANVIAWRDADGQLWEGPKPGRNYFWVFSNPDGVIRGDCL